jgi:hypothetical protein
MFTLLNRCKLSSIEFPFTIQIQVQGRYINRFAQPFLLSLIPYSPTTVKRILVTAGVIEWCMRIILPATPNIDCLKRVCFPLLNIDASCQALSSLLQFRFKFRVDKSNSTVDLLNPSSRSIANLKGTVPRDFRLLVFFHKSVSLNP